jgi:hypothetical protein
MKKEISKKVKQSNASQSSSSHASGLQLDEGQIRFESGLKINISVYRVLRLLHLLSDSDGLCFEVIAQALSDDPLVQKTFHEETINNYLHTLKRSGLKWKRPHVNNGLVYKLTERFISTDWRDVDILAMKHLLRHVDILNNPMDQWIAKTTLEGWLSEALQNNPDASLEGSITRVKKVPKIPEEPNSLELGESPHIQDQDAFSELITRLIQYCKEEQWLKIELNPQEEAGFAVISKYQEILHLSHDSNEPDEQLLTIHIEPYELMIKDEMLCLLGYVKEWEALCQIPVKVIQCVCQEPGKARKTVQPVTVKFKLTGRLARTYRLYPGESLLEEHLSEETESSIVVEAKTLDTEQLVKRLLKYHAQCEVISPGFVRQKMIQQIDRLISGSS